MSTTSNDSVSHHLLNGLLVLLSICSATGCGGSDDGGTLPSTGPAQAAPQANTAAAPMPVIPPAPSIEPQTNRAATSSTGSSNSDDASTLCTPRELVLARALFDALARQPNVDEDVTTRQVARAQGITTDVLDRAYINCVAAHKVP